MADKGSIYRRSTTNTPTSIHDARNVRKAKETVGSSMLTYKSGQRSRSPINADPYQGSYLEQSLRKRIRDLEQAAGGKSTPRTPDRRSNRELSPSEILRTSLRSPSPKYAHTPKQSQGPMISFLDNENNNSNQFGRKDRSITEPDLSIIENDYRRRENSPQKLLDSSKEEERYLQTLKGNMDHDSKSPKKIENNSPGSVRFEEFMRKLKRDKQDFYQKLEQQSRKLSPEVIRNNPYIPQDSKYLDQSIEDLITKRVGSMRMNFKHFQDEFDRMVKRQREFWQTSNVRKNDVDTLVGNLKRSPLRNPSPQPQVSASAKNMLIENGKNEERVTPSPRRGDESARTTKSMGYKNTKNKKSTDNLSNKKKVVTESNKSSQGQLDVYTSDEVMKLRSDVEYLKKRLQDKDIEILKVRKGLHEAQENVLKVRVEKEKENVELMEALEHNRKQREKIENELDKALKKLVKLQKTFNDNAESFSMMKRQYEQFKNDLRTSDDLPGKLKQLEAQLLFQEDTNTRLIKNLDEILVKSDHETTELEYGYMLRLNEKSNELELTKLQKEKAEIELNNALKKMTENELYYQNQIDSLKDIISSLEKNEDETRDDTLNIQLEYRVIKDKYQALVDKYDQLSREFDEANKNHVDEIQKIKYAYEFEAQNKTIEMAALQKKLFQAEESIRRAQDESTVEHEKLKNMFNDLYREYEDYRSVQSDNMEKYKQEQSEEKMRIASLKMSQQDSTKVQELEMLYKQQIDDQNEQIKRLNAKIMEIDRIEKQKSEDSLNRIMQQYESFKNEQTKAMDKILNESEDKITKLVIEIKGQQAENDRLRNSNSDKDTQIQALKEELEKSWTLVKNTQDSSAISLSEKEKQIQKLKDDLEKSFNMIQSLQSGNNSGAQNVIDALQAEIKSRDVEIESQKAKLAQAIRDLSADKDKAVAERDKAIAEKDSLIKERDNISKEKDRLAGELQSKANEIQSLQTERNRLSDELKRAQSGSPNTSTVVADNSEVNNLRDQLAKIQIDHANYVKAQESEKKVLEDLNQASLNKVDTIQKELTAQKTASDEALRAKDAELQALNQKYQTSVEDYKRLTSQISTTSSSSNSQVALLQSEIARLQTQNQDQNAAFQKDLNATKSKYEQDLAKSKDDLAKADQALTQAKAENESTKATLNSQINELNKKIAAVEAEKSELAKKYDALQQEYTTYKTDQEKKLLQQGSSQSSQVAELQNKITELNQTVINKTKEIEKLQADLAKANNDTGSAMTALNELQGELAKSKALLTAAQQEKEDLTKALNSEKLKLDDLQKKLAASEAEKNNTLQVLDQVQKANTQTVADYENKIKQIQAQASQGQGNQAQLVQLQDENKKLKNVNQELAGTKAMLEINTQQLTQLKTLLEESDKQIKDLEGQVAAAKAKDAEIATLKKQVDDMKGENSKISASENQAVQELVALKTQMADLQTKLAAASSGGANTANLEKKVKALEQDLKDNQDLMEYYKSEVGRCLDQITQYDAREQGYLKQIRELKKK